jgi:hypothetical protein
VRLDDGLILCSIFEGPFGDGWRSHQAKCGHCVNDMRRDEMVHLLDT